MKSISEIFQIQPVNVRPMNTTAYITLIMYIQNFTYNNCYKTDKYFKSIDSKTWTAPVVEWLAHSAAMCSRVWRAQWMRFAPQHESVRLPKNYW